jgi:hypothetical protein
LRATTVSLQTRPSASAGDGSSDTGGKEAGNDEGKENEPDLPAHFKQGELEAKLALDLHRQVPKHKKAAICSARQSVSVLSLRQRTGPPGRYQPALSMSFKRCSDETRVPANAVDGCTNAERSSVASDRLQHIK